MSDKISTRRLSACRARLCMKSRAISSELISLLYASLTIMLPSPPSFTSKRISTGSSLATRGTASARLSASNCPISRSACSTFSSDALSVKGKVKVYSFPEKVNRTSVAALSLSTLCTKRAAPLSLRLQPTARVCKPLRASPSVISASSALYTITLLLRKRRSFSSNFSAVLIKFS